MRKLTALLVVALLASSASAAWTLSKADEGYVGDTGLAYMTLDITADVVPNTITCDGFDGITGNLYQVGTITPGGPPDFEPTYTYSPTESIAVGNYYDAAAVDSHFLVNSDDLAVVKAPAEDNDFSLGLEPIYDYYDWGLGTYLKGTFGDTSISGDLTWEFAYLVGNPGEWAGVNAYFSGEGENSPVFEGNTPGVDQFQFIPEPATMSLLALGGVAALIRRKR